MIDDLAYVLVLGRLSFIDGPQTGLTDGPLIVKTEQNRVSITVSSSLQNDIKPLTIIGKGAQEVSLCVYAK